MVIASILLLPLLLLIILLIVSSLVAYLSYTIPAAKKQHNQHFLPIFGIAYPLSNHPPHFGHRGRVGSGEDLGAAASNLAPSAVGLTALRQPFRGQKSPTCVGLFFPMAWGLGGLAPLEARLLKKSEQTAATQGARLG